MAKMPGAESSIWMVIALLRLPWYVRRSVAKPAATVEGITALICVGETKMGNAWVTTPFCVTLMETPASVEESGNDNDGLLAGPRFSPNVVKTLPRAMGAFGRPKGA